MTRAALIGVALAGLCGCAGLPVALQVLTAAGTGISLLTTGKGVSDHLLSAALDRDCALFRFIGGSDPCRARAPAEDAVQVVAAIDERQDISLLRSASLDIHPAAVGAALTPPRLYLVVGSFVDADYARAFRRRYPEFRLAVSRMPGTVPTYRVVAGPVPQGGLFELRRRLDDAGLSDTLPVQLCAGALVAPPCTDLLASVDGWPETPSGPAVERQ